MKKISRRIFILSTIFGFFIASLSLAMVNWPPSPFFGTKLTSESKVGDLVKYFYEWGIALGGLAAFISLIIGGFQYLTSMGEPARLAEAKDRIKSAFFLLGKVGRNFNRK